MERVTKKALVTGAGTRIGQALAVHVARQGFDVVVHYSTNEAGARETAQQVAQLGRDAHLFRADFSQLSEVQALARFVKRTFGVLDILINNASVFPSPDKVTAPNSFLQESEESWELSLAINAKAPFFLIQYLAEELKQSGSGVVINMLDSSVSQPILSRAAHTISKNALSAITTLAAKSFAKDFRVNALELGAILPPPGYEEAGLRARRWGGIEPVLRGVQFIIETPFLNGEIVRLDGGEHLE